ncbi:MAG: hypothetical protein AB7D06_18640 [Pedobacter sp.]
MSKQELSDEYLSNLTEIFVLVHQKTLDKTLRWETTVDDDIFQASLRNYTILLHSFQNSFIHDRPFLEIIDGNGNIIETITPIFLSGMIDDFERKIFELNYWSKRTALDIDKSLIEVLKELKGEIDGGTF